MSILLNPIELRVVGVLIEKALSQPDSYPLTLNSMVLGANQKQNREPIVSLSESQVAKAVHDLQLRNLIRQAPPVPGARANRFEPNVLECFHWDRREQAVMAELMLRGRQTAGELRTRASRMTSFADLPAVLAVIRELSGADPPFVEELPREPGRSANRFRHLMSPEDESVFTSVAESHTRSDDVPEAAGLQSPVGESPDHGCVDLTERVQRLECRMDELGAVVDELRSRISMEKLDRSTGWDV